MPTSKNGGIPDAWLSQPPTQHAGHRGLGERVSPDYPLRWIKAGADASLERRPRCWSPCTRCAASAPSTKSLSTTCTAAGSWT